MNQNKINIISFDVPFPPNYGGVIDVYYKIKELHKAGYKIILHCFEYGRKPQQALKNICDEIYYYKRKKGFQYLLYKLPYIVITRKNRELLDNLKKNDYPIIFEGLHTCYFLDHPDIVSRQKIVRMHNIEHHYYNELAKASGNLANKIYYKIERNKLRRFVKIIKSATCIATISKNDFNYFKKSHQNTVLLPAFHPFEKVDSKAGNGDNFLYHGNLAVEENEKAAIFLVDKVFKKTGVNLIIAGKSPTKKIRKIVEPLKNIYLVSNPSEKEMSELIQNSHCCILPTFQSTGLKLKLLVSLFTGKHVIANNMMVANTGLESLCNIANNAQEFIQQVNKLSTKSFTEEVISERKKIFKKFSNNHIIQELIKEINEQ